MITSVYNRNNNGTAMTDTELREGKGGGLWSSEILQFGAFEGAQRFPPS